MTSALIIAGCIGKRPLKIFGSVKRRRGKPKRTLDRYIVLLAYGLINHVSDDHFQTEKIEASDPIYWAFPTLSLKKLVLKCINVTAKDKQ